jgi:hypothetical protein
MPARIQVFHSSGQQLTLINFSGDGDWKHIGYRVERRGPIEITSSVRALATNVILSTQQRSHCRCCLPLTM